MRGRTLGILLIVTLNAAVVCLLAAAWVHVASFRAEWQTYRAQIGVAHAVVEDPINAYDPLLGWKHIPGRVLAMADAFPGEGVVFEINEQGFRDTREFTKAVPPGMTRAVAVGDSFTFGNVRTDETWPTHLERQHESLEVINMGASGYGVDQMYLWYREDGVAFEAERVICAFIEDDLLRALRYSWPSGYGRPIFHIEDGELVLSNVPVPRKNAPGELNVHPGDFVAFLQQRRRSDEPNYPSGSMLEVPLRVLSAFRDLVESHDRAFHAVFLPTISDLESGCLLLPEVKQYCLGNGIDLLDTTDPLRAEMVEASIFRDDGHYNSLGNQIVARAVYEHVRPVAASADAP